MNTKKLLILALTAAALFTACSEEKHTNSWEDENSDASFAEDYNKRICIGISAYHLGRDTAVFGRNMRTFVILRQRTA